MTRRHNGLASRPVASLALVCAVAALHMASAHAHAFLDHAAPAVGSVVHAAPPEVRLWFTQRLEPAFSTIQVVDPDGKRIDKADAHVEGADQAVLVVSVPQLASGAYHVTWRVLSVDTHVTEGDFTFNVSP
jgi:methionine-rich copper-binding protein CopC